MYKAWRMERGNLKQNWSWGKLRSEVRNKGCHSLRDRLPDQHPFLDMHRPTRAWDRWALGLKRQLGPHQALLCILCVSIVNEVILDSVAGRWNFALDTSLEIICFRTVHIIRVIRQLDPVALENWELWLQVLLSKAIKRVISMRVCSRWLSQE